MPTIVASLRRMAGRVVLRVRCVYYEFQGSLDRSRGAFELTLDDGSVVVLDSASDGDSLRFDEGPWIDPFDGPLDEVNADFVAKSGKWTAFDVGDDPRFAALIGEKISDVRTIHDAMDKVIGVVFWVGSHDVRAEVRADDLYVTIA
jgi:hypothetical protein